MSEPVVLPAADSAGLELPPPIAATASHPSPPTALTAHRQRQADHDTIRALASDQLDDARQPVLGRCALDHAERPRDGSRRIADGHAGAGPAEVEREDLHRSASAIACFPAS